MPSNYRRKFGNGLNWRTVYFVNCVTWKIGKVYRLEYIEIPGVFFMQHHKMWCQQVALLIAVVQRNCGHTSLLLERINKFSNGVKRNSGIHSHFCVIQGNCIPTVTVVHNVGTLQTVAMVYIVAAIHVSYFLYLYILTEFHIPNFSHLI